MSKFFRLRFRLCAMALLVLGATGWAGAAFAQVTPKAGSFLVATRGQAGIFSGSVVLLIAYGPDGALGLIVNRLTKFPLAKALSGESKLSDPDKPLYFGGPVALDHVTLLIRSKMPPPAAVRVLVDIYASSSMKTLRAVAGNKLPDARFRAYAGYAGWAPAQLEAEIARGDWKVLSATADDVFAKDPADLWEKLIQQQKSWLVEVPRTDSPRQQPVLGLNNPLDGERHDK